jgi:glycosyltransferase involved in cell wall biosynthesis
MTTNSKKLKIAVYAISKNEEKFIERFYESCKDADVIVLADTGSTDDTIKKAKSLGINVYDICITPWRFDKARDAALALVPRDIDVCVSLDIDEIMMPGWREEIEKHWKKGKTTRFRYGYDWGNDIRFQYEKIHARHGYFWHHPCHEYPVPDTRIHEVYAESGALLVRHLPDTSKSRGQYLDLLQASVKEDPSCPRNAFYYARELTFWSRWEESIVALKKYLEMPNATWINERCYAMRLLGKSYFKIGKIADSFMWHRRACAEAPSTREPWCDLAAMCYKFQLWEECYSSATTALKIINRQLVYTCDPLVWGSMPHDYASIAAWNMGLKEEAIKHAANAVEIDPTNDRLVKNLELMKQEK